VPRSQAIEVPTTLASSYARAFGAEGGAWLTALPALAREFLDRWELERDGEPGSGEASLVLPVLRADGTRAVLKLQMPRQETTAAVIGLRTWNGGGMVRLLDHDPGSGAMLLERLDGARTLASVEDDDVAMGILAGLQARLVAVRAPQGLLGLGDIATEMVGRVPEAVAALADRDDRRLLRAWASAVAELAGEPGDRLLHWICTTTTFLPRSANPGSRSILNRSPGTPASTCGPPWTAGGRTWSRRAAPGEWCGAASTCSPRRSAWTARVPRAGRWGDCCRTRSGTSTMARRP